MRASVGFVSLGCPKNLVDTERMMDLLSKDGAVLTGDQSSADIVVINTCGFLEPAKNESMDTIGEFVELKRKSKIRGVVVTGCMTERYLGLMRQAYPDVDAFLQTKEFSKIVDVVRWVMDGETVELKRRTQLQGEQLTGHSELSDFVRRSPGKRSFAYVKIAEGCNRVCSFCIIPKLRGKLHSRSVSGIVDEVRQLVEHGTQEVVLIAQDLTSYGRDIGTHLLHLLRALDGIEGLRWYRLMYNYPRFFDDELIQYLASSEKFCRYLDIPFQHISDRLLKLMKRPEGKTEIYSLIEKLRTALPDLSLRTTLMVGFPGETAEDFEELLEFVRSINFEHLGAFTYYQEEGTPSYELPNQVPEKIKKARYQELMSLQKSLQKKKLKDLVGRVLPVMVDGFAEETKGGLVYRARHPGQAPEVDGMTYLLSDRELVPGLIYDVKISKIMGDYDLLAIPAEGILNPEDVKFSKLMRK
jgi:ribosomal protein S12 methylthiotransferase